MIRKIIHIDMDYFYAQVEERDNPSLKGKPVAVGGRADGRGVLTTCNYLAREFGIRSAMPTAQALQRCPQLVLLPVNMDKYKAASQQIRQIFTAFTDKIEPLSLDEAYLDVTECKLQQNSATRIAQAIKQQIRDELNLTASAGVAPNKFLAKIASDWRKPDGLFVLTPSHIPDFIQQLPVSKIFGVGKVTQRKLAQMEIDTCADLQALSLEDLTVQFGKFGHSLYQYCRGIDERPVNANRIRQSVSVETTFPQDLPDLAACRAQLPVLASNLKKRLKPHSHRVIKAQVVKIKAHDFSQTTLERQCQVFDAGTYTDLLADALSRLNKPVRLLGIGVRFAELETAPAVQLSLF